MPSGPSTQSYIGGAQAGDGTVGTYHTGPLPTPQGAITATVPSTDTAINGGTTTLQVSASGTIVTVYVGVSPAGGGAPSGYWEITVPIGVPVEQVLLTLEQELGAQQFAIEFEVADAAGDVSAPVSTETTIQQVGTGDVQVSVSWDALNDLDLHVVDPNGFEVYWEAKVSPQGGTLDLDSNAGCAIDGVNNENVTWPTGAAPHGTYTVRVDNYDNCSGMAANYVVTVQKTGSAPVMYSGSFAASDPGDNGGAGSGTTVTTFTFP